MSGPQFFYSPSFWNRFFISKNTHNLIERQKKYANLSKQEHKLLFIMHKSCLLVAVVVAMVSRYILFFLSLLPFCLYTTKPDTPLVEIQQTHLQNTPKNLYTLEISLSLCLEANKCKYVTCRICGLATTSKPKHTNREKLLVQSKAQCFVHIIIIVIVIISIAKCWMKQSLTLHCEHTKKLIVPKIC